MVKGMVVLTVLWNAPTVSVALTFTDVRPALKLLLGVPDNTPSVDRFIPCGRLIAAHVIVAAFRASWVVRVTGL
jgi:hypothetical protein